MLPEKNRSVRGSDPILECCESEDERTFMVGRRRWLVRRHPELFLDPAPTPELIRWWVRFYMTNPEYFSEENHRNFEQLPENFDPKAPGEPLDMASLLVSNKEGQESSEKNVPGSIAERAWQETALAKLRNHTSRLRRKNKKKNPRQAVAWRILVRLFGGAKAKAVEAMDRVVMMRDGGINVNKLTKVINAVGNTKLANQTVKAALTKLLSEIAEVDGKAGRIREHDATRGDRTCRTAR